MSHDAGKGNKLRSFSVSQNQYVKNLGSIFGQSLEPSDDDEDCSSCRGPMYTQIHWGYSYCDDCGTRIKKESMDY